MAAATDDASASAGWTATTKQLGGFHVRRRETGDRIDHEDDDVGLANREPGLVLDLLLDGIARMDLEPTGVDNDEASTVPLGVAVDPGSRGAGPAFDNGGAVTDYAVEEGALADVRATYDGDDG